MEINTSITNILKISLCYSFLVNYFISNLRYLRNIETMIEKMVSGNGNSYEIKIYGETELRPILPWIK